MRDACESCTPQLLLDLDGTLIPFAARTEDANLDVGAVRVLGALHDAGIHVVIVSGRPHTLLAPMRLLAPHAWWAAEHGTWRYDDSRRWSGSNRALWPLFHGFPGHVQYTDADWTAYVEANAEFARHASALAHTDSVVWVHDYHLLLTGHALRQRGFVGPIGMFLHIPFPPCDLFDTLPWADEVIAAMLAFDLVGFHTEQWAENFRASARARSGGRALPDVAVLPIGVEQQVFASDGALDDPEVAGLQAALGPRRMILGVDRLDYAKGVPERLLAFECLLDTRPEWRGQICFVQISVPIARGRTGICGAPSPRGDAGGPHQWSVRRGELGARALPVPFLRPGGARAAIP